MPHDVITQLLRVLAIETKQEKAIINADAADAGLSGLEAFSFDYIVKWPLFAGAFALRQRMLNFVQNIQYYMMFEVMEPTWHVMESNLKTVSGARARRDPPSGS
ncbi:Gamma-tubulin complex component 2 [Liparis tanakae]|uniref:Gamma-tubulin complex component n=1 Tax=Liparis tanakae TaxID=230148 RepID=A0A4Z2E137_9TELE|nr:Gamma-tubulin complex component 2 [Liparis tanakae]